MKAKIDVLGTGIEIKNIRDFYRCISYFKKGFQPRTNIVKDAKIYLFADSHRILARS
jgi:hypothetical protein